MLGSIHLLSLSCAAADPFVNGDPQLLAFDHNYNLLTRKNGWIR